MHMGITEVTAKACQAAASGAVSADCEPGNCPGTDLARYASPGRIRAPGTPMLPPFGDPRMRVHVAAGRAATLVPAITLASAPE